MNATSHVLQYLKGTHHYQLTYRQNDCAELIGYSDSDWAADTDDCRSTTRYCYTLTGACITWQTHKQCTVVLSSTEAEYMALTETAKHSQWVIQLLQQLNFKVSTIKLYSNSLGACTIAENPVHHSHTKHIKIQHHYIWDAVQDSTFNLSSVPTKDNIADTLMKSFTHDQHQFLCKKLGLIDGSIVGGWCEPCYDYTKIVFLQFSIMPSLRLQLPWVNNHTHAYTELSWVEPSTNKPTESSRICYLVIPSAIHTKNRVMFQFYSSPYLKTFFNAYLLILHMYS